MGQNIIYFPKLLLADYCCTLGGLLAMYYGISLCSIMVDFLKYMARKIFTYFKLNIIFKFLENIIKIILFLSMMFQLIDIINDYIYSNNKLIVTFDERLYIPGIQFTLSGIFDHKTRKTYDKYDMYDLFVSKIDYLFIHVLKVGDGYLSFQLFVDDEIFYFDTFLFYLRTNYKTLETIIVIDTDVLNNMNLTKIEKMRFIFNRIDYDSVSLIFYNNLYKEYLFNRIIKPFKKYTFKLQPSFYSKNDVNLIQHETVFPSSRHRDFIEDCLKNKYQDGFHSCIPYYFGFNYIKVDPSKYGWGRILFGGMRYN